MPQKWINFLNQVKINGENQDYVGEYMLREKKVSANSTNEIYFDLCIMF